MQAAAHQAIALSTIVAVCLLIIWWAQSKGFL